MKKYVVAVISFFDNDIRQFKIEAESEYEAAKLGMIEFTPEEYRQDEINYQKAEGYPENYEKLILQCNNSDMDISVIEI